MLACAGARMLSSKGASPDAPPGTAQDLRRGNVQDFVAYGFYCSCYAALPRAQRDATEEFIQEVERTWGVGCVPALGEIMKVKKIE